LNRIKKERLGDHWSPNVRARCTFKFKYRSLEGKLRDELFVYFLGDKKKMHRKRNQKRGYTTNKKYYHRQVNRGGGGIINEKEIG
jgi:hypothetical protein